MKTENISLWALVTALAFSAIFSSCGRLSGKEKEFIGAYYNPAVSETTPAFELRDDGSSVIRAEIPGEINVSVPGNWSIEGNILVIENNPEKAVISGDKSMMGEISRKIRRSIRSYDKQTLVLIDEGLEYAYRRRPV